MYFRLSFLNMQVKDSDKSNVSFDTQYQGHKLNRLQLVFQFWSVQARFDSGLNFHVSHISTGIFVCVSEEA